MAGRKSILVVVESQEIMDAYKNIFAENYDVTSVLYKGTKTNIPANIFDGAIVDNLYDNWRVMAENINAEQTFIVWAGHTFIRKPTENGLWFLSKHHTDFGNMARRTLENE